MNIDISSLNPLVLPSVWMSDRRELPKAPGVYFVTRGLFVVYIGQSANMFTRWNEHHIKKAIPRDRRKLFRIAWVKARLRDLDELEIALIKLWRPEMNADTKGVGRKKRAASKMRRARHWRKWGVYLIREVFQNGYWYSSRYLVSAKDIAKSLPNIEEMTRDYWPNAEATRYRIRPYEPMDRPKAGRKKAKKAGK